jgi:hypothetical protein
MSSTSGTHFTNETFSKGDDVYLTEQYYQDFKLSILQVPRYGWKVNELIEYSGII